MKAIHRECFPDGSMSFVLPDHRWDIALPTGRHVRGAAVDLDSAKAAIVAAHNEFILGAWQHGRPYARGQYVVPLGERQR
jgi:hypothetical protein